MLGKERVSVVQTLNHVGRILVILGDYTKAQSMHQRALDIFELCNERQGAATGIGDLGVVMLKQGHFFEAKKYCNQAVEMRTKEFGGRHPSVAHSLNVLGLVMYYLSDLESAKRCFSKALDIFNDEANLETAWSLDSLGMVMWDYRDY